MKIEITCVAEMYSHSDFNLITEEYSEYRVKSLPRPQYKQTDYELMERLGVLVPFRAVNENKLIGFMTILEAKVPHYGLKLSIVESLFVRKQFRQTGAGVRLIKTAEAFATNCGSEGLFINCPIGGELLDILPRMGYSLETYNFFKRLCTHSPLPQLTI